MSRLPRHGTLLAFALLLGPAPAALAAEATTAASAVEATTSAPAAEEATIDPKAPDAMRCRKIAVTGSLVKKERICKTNAEWAQAGEDARKNADDLITRNRPGQRFE
jgi:hypothetical protein